MKKLDRILWSILMVAALYAGFTFWGYKLLQKDNVLSSWSIGENQALIEATNEARITTASYDSSKVESATTERYAVAKLLADQAISESGVGRLVIPKVSIQLPILAGVTEENLLNGATMYSPKQKMGKGNYVLMAHNIYDLDTLFYRIKDLATGDAIFLTDGIKLYEYETFFNQEVNFSRGDLLQDPQPEKNIVTLFRCEGGIGTPWRRVVQGKFVREENLKEITADQRDILSISLTDLQSKNVDQSFTSLSGIERLALWNIHFFLNHYLLILGSIAAMLLSLLAVTLYFIRVSDEK